MNRFTQLSINGKGVQSLFLDGKRAYIAAPDFRHILNEDAYDILKADTVAETLTYNNKSYSIYNSITRQNTWTDKGKGNVRPWMVTESILMFAHHWGSASSISFGVDINGQTVTVQSKASGAQINLKEWCLQNGWTENELPGTTASNAYYDFSFADIDFILCDKPSTSLKSICPYFISEITMKKIFWAQTTKGVVGWRQSQASNNMIPVYFSNMTYGQDFYAPSSYLNEIPEENLKSLNAITDTQYPTYTGDSGKPLFVNYKGKDIVLTQAQTNNSGANFVKAFPYIKAFVEAHGDTLNEFTSDMVEEE